MFFAPGSAVLRNSQKLILRDLADVLDDRNQIKVSLVSRRHKAAPTKLGKKRNTAVVRYLRSLGLEATFERTNVAGKGSKSTAKKNNRVTLTASWLN